MSSMVARSSSRIWAGVNTAGRSNSVAQTGDVRRAGAIAGTFARHRQSTSSRPSRLPPHGRATTTTTGPGERIHVRQRDPELCDAQLRRQLPPSARSSSPGRSPARAARPAPRSPARTTTPVPRSLPTASLAANRAAKCSTGLAAGPAVGDLGRGEEPLLQTRDAAPAPAGSAPPPPGPDRQRPAGTAGSSGCAPGLAHGYSTVTVLARLRGWSTFSPCALAT